MIMKLEELTKLFTSLTAKQQEEFSKIATDYVVASSDPDVVPILFKVQKSAFSSSGIVRIPTEFLTEDAKAARRVDGAKRSKQYRQSMTEEEREEFRQKEAERKRIARANAKTKSSDPSP